MDYAALRGQLEAVTDGDEVKLGELAWDMRTLLRARQSHTEHSERVDRIMADWNLDWTWMKPWLDLFEKAICQGSDEQMADWLAAGAPEVTGQPEGLPESSAVAC